MRACARAAPAARLVDRRHTVLCEGALAREGQQQVAAWLGFGFGFGFGVGFGFGFGFGFGLGLGQQQVAAWRQVELDVVRLARAAQRKCGHRRRATATAAAASATAAAAAAAASATAAAAAAAAVRVDQDERDVCHPVVDRGPASLARLQHGDVTPGHGARARVRARVRVRVRVSTRSAR